MKSHRAKTWVVVDTLVAASLLAGCGAISKKQPETAQARVPPQIEKMEQLSKDAYEKALAGDRKAVDDSAFQLAVQADSYRAQAAREDAPAKTLEELDAAVEELREAAIDASPIELGRAANRVSGSMDELLALHDPAVPPEVVEVGYLGRELALDGMEEDTSRASKDLAQLRARWTEVRPRVLAAGGSQQAQQLDQSLTELRAEVEVGDGAAITARANELLDQVEQLEEVFQKG